MTKRSKKMAKTASLYILNSKIRVYFQGKTLAEEAAKQKPVETRGKTWLTPLKMLDSHWLKAPTPLKMLDSHWLKAIRLELKTDGQGGNLAKGGSKRRKKGGKSSEILSKHPL